MECNQKINCTVASCKYNNTARKVCKLEAIKVSPKTNINSGTPDESECSSYECQ